jgi:hypothetical protein
VAQVAWLLIVIPEWQAGQVKFTGDDSNEKKAKLADDFRRNNIEVRLGGIYSLERIAHDSPRDQWTIIETLSAFESTSKT